MDTASLFSDVRGEIRDARDLVDGFDDARLGDVSKRLDKVMATLNRIGKYVEEIEHATARPVMTVGKIDVRAIGKIDVRAIFAAADKRFPLSGRQAAE